VGSLLVAAGAAPLAFLSLEREAFGQAARFGDKGQLAITAENLFAFSSERVAQSFPDGEHSVTTNRFGFLYSEGSATPRGPQVGGHYFIIPSLSLGGTLGYESRGGSVSQPVGNRGIVTQDSESISTFVFVPKVGYALMLTNILGFWFRGGPGFFRIGTSDPAGRVRDANSYLLLSLDAFFVVTPVQHVGFYVGPQADISFSGTHSHTDENGIETSQSASYRSLGLGLGIITYFGL
jgi:hypothetical protein